jgi:hypothetical protein
VIQLIQWYSWSSDSVDPADPVIQLIQLIQWSSDSVDPADPVIQLSKCAVSDKSNESKVRKWPKTIIWAQIRPKLAQIILGKLISVVKPPLVAEDHCQLL